MLREVGEDQYVANNVTKALAAPGGVGVVYGYVFDISMPVDMTDLSNSTTVLNPTFLALPEYLKTHGYKNPDNPIDSPWQAGYNTDQHPFVWLQSHPEHFQLFMTWVHVSREGLPVWTDVFPFEEEIAKNSTDDTVIFVDIGSALGHISIGLREKYPDLPGKVVIQDQQHVISAVQPSHGIEPMVYDFFTPQPIKGEKRSLSFLSRLVLTILAGARAYYMRNIIHDHSDEAARQILQNTISAMTEESVLLIDDMMLPESGAPWRATQLDMTMMTCLAAKERSVNEWYALLDSVDLKVVKVVKYTEECDDCIIVAKPAKFVK